MQSGSFVRPASASIKVGDVMRYESFIFVFLDETSRDDLHNDIRHALVLNGRWFSFYDFEIYEPGQVITILNKDILGEPVVARQDGRYDET